MFQYSFLLTPLKPLPHPYVYSLEKEDLNSVCRLTLAIVIRVVLLGGWWRQCGIMAKLLDLRLWIS